MNTIVTLIAAIPLVWTVETSRVQPAMFEAYHGEELQLAATFKSYGKDLAIDGMAALFYQTNGMGTTYWTAPATVSSNRITAVWAPEMDPGAQTVNGFLGVAGKNYRAAFKLRFLPSPGAVPGEIPLPAKRIDFGTVEVLNAPYYTKNATDERIIELAPTPGNYETVSNSAMLAVSRSGDTMTGSLAVTGTVSVTDRFVSLNDGRVALAASFDAGDDVFAYDLVNDKITIGKWNEIDDYSYGSVSIGIDQSVDGYNAVAIGSNASAVGQAAVAIGADASALGDATSALGTGAHAEGNFSLALGENVQAVGDCATAIGEDCYAGEYSIAIGNSVNASLEGERGVAIGWQAQTGIEAVDAIAIGSYAYGQADNSIAIGNMAIIDDSSAADSIVIGRESTVVAGNSVAIGTFEYVDAGHSNAVVIGNDGSGERYFSHGTNTLNFGVTSDPERVWFGERTMTEIIAASEADPNVAAWAKQANKPTYTAAEVGAAPASVADTVNTWVTYWDGDEVRVTITNYYGSVDLPSLYIEQQITDGGTNYYKTIWAEKARLGVLTDRIRELEQDLDTKADRAWGFYDSHTGNFAPEGYTSISSGAILISKDMSYQKTVTAGGDVWVLTANDPTVVTGVESNGFFRITDAEGNSVIEVVKGDKRTVPAIASAVTAGGNSISISYHVVSDSHPLLEICGDLAEADWVAEGESACPATAVWSGQSGAYSVTLTGKAPMDKMFVRGTYEVGGETYVKHDVAVGFDKVVIGGVYYRVAVETVNGKKLMVLTEY